MHMEVKEFQEEASVEGIRLGAVSVEQAKEEEVLT